MPVGLNYTFAQALTKRLTLLKETVGIIYNEPLFYRRHVRKITLPFKPLIYRGHVRLITLPFKPLIYIGHVRLITLPFKPLIDK